MQTDLAASHNVEHKRFEVSLGSALAELTYQISGNIITFIHTGVPMPLEGRGIGSLLVSAGLKYARTNNLQVESLCWFVDKYMQRHPNE